MKRFFTVSLGILSFSGFVFVFFVSPLVRAESLYIPMVFEDVNGDPIMTSLDLRVSLWDSYEVRPDDIDENGDINILALHYGQYQTTTTIVPDENGYFFPVTYGFNKLDIFSLPSFPVLSPFNAYLQVEYKYAGDPDTSYMILDFVDDPPFQNVTRYNLDPNGVYYTFEAGPRTSWNTFTLDVNNNATTQVRLQFGETLAEYLEWNISNTRFELSDDLHVPGLLTGLTGISSSGTINFESASVGIGTASPASALHVADGYYAQFEDNNAGAPPLADCDEDLERGRISLDTTNNRLYVCNGATRGWDYVDLTD